MQFKLGDRVQITKSNTAQPFGTIVGVYDRMQYAYENTPNYLLHMASVWGNMFQIEPGVITQEPAYVIRFDEKRLTVAKSVAIEQCRKEGFSDAETQLRIEEHKVQCCFAPERDLVLSTTVIPDTVPANWEAS